MQQNKEFFKRWSTYANGLSIVVGAAVAGIPSLDLSATTTGYIMLASSVVVAACQWIKQEAK